MTTLVSPPRRGETRSPKRSALARRQRRTEFLPRQRRARGEGRYFGRHGWVNTLVQSNMSSGVRDARFWPVVSRR
jgi:hypothetical protein